MSDEVEIPGELVDTLVETLAEIKRLTAAVVTIKDAIKSMLGHAEIGTVAGEPAVRWAHVKSRRLDMHELRAQVDPAIIASCYVEDMTRRFIPLGKVAE